MGTSMKHPVSEGVKPSFVIFDIWAHWRSEWASRGYNSNGLVAVPSGQG